MIKKVDLKLRIGIIVAIVALSIFYIFPIDKNLNLGLDLQGGMSVLLRADTSKVPDLRKQDAISAAVEKIRNRIDIYGVKETSIQLQGADSILVQVPGLVSREMVDTLKGVGNLEFKLVEEDSEKIKQALAGEIAEGYELKEFDGKKYLLLSEPQIVGSDLAESFVGFDQYNTAAIQLRFTAEGAKKFAKVTQENVDRQLAILLDGVMKSDPPVIRQPILSGEGEITGRFTMDDARLTTSILNSGALPVPLSVEEERSVGPLLGSDSIKRGVNSILFGASLVVIFVVIYYFLGGFITIICLALNVLFILAGLHLFRGTLTLPGIAGVILTLGMAVDANVLIFERIREELRLHKPLSISVKNGFERAKRTIIDANITTLIAAFFLYIFGTGPIKGFATTLSLGIVASIFTSVFVGRTIFSMLLDLKLKKFPMLSIVPSLHFNFVKAKSVSLVISIIAIFVSVTYFYSHSDQFYGIDFKGGQFLEYKIDPPADIENVRSILNEKGYDNLTIQEFKDIAGGVIIKSKEDISSDVYRILGDKFGSVEELRVTTIGPTVGKILKRKAYLAILLSLLGILAYVFVRFKHFDFAIAAVVALLHDVLITLGFLCFFGYEINLLTVTALLTIAGYSINDTIVIYDRIREISPRMHKSKLSEIINTAINSTLARTIITSITTLFVVVSIFCFGGEALHGFSFALMIGIVAGTYSSIYIASPMVLLFRKTRV
jgi:SecD/SecF fusion protein